MLARVFFGLCFGVAIFPAYAQDAAEFGAWRAFCAPTAGCALGTTAQTGDRLAFSEPPSGDDRLLLVANAEPLRGSVMTVTLDGFPGAILGPSDGWRAVQTEAGRAIQIAPSITENELMPRMLKANQLEIRYVTIDGVERMIDFALNGYADARGYADGG